ncbi:hypothetical protein DMA11_02320 [Marinilabiliaceae bacterium JC017]|nr:hypothetical protein DMA11_02320 [Marinilabiliaceae bacterium JC017]
MKQIVFSLFNTAERFLFLQMVTKILEKKLTAIPALQTIYNRLVALRDLMEQAIFKEKGSSFTGMLNKQDDSQDHGFQCLRFGVMAQLHSIIDINLREKASLIESIIRRHGWSLFSFGYSKQLTASRSLITELKEPDNLKMIDDLGLRADFDAWCDAVDEFERIYTHKVEDASTDNSASAYDLGKEAVELLEKLLPGWYYQGEFTEDAGYKELVDAVIESGAAIEAQARARATRRANKKEAELN